MRDHIRAFNVAVSDYRLKPSEKGLNEVEKILGVLSSVSNTSVFSPSSSETVSLLVHCRHLLDSLDQKCGTLWAVVAFLSHLAADPAITAILQGRLHLLPSCAKLLSSLPPTTRARTLKLLRLMRLLVIGVKIHRREAFLSSLFSDLQTFLADSEFAPHALFIISSLCFENYVATKFMLETIPDKVISDLLSRPASTGELQMCAEILFYNLGRLSLSRPVLPGKVSSYLGKVTTVFCDSYRDLQASPDSSAGLSTMILTTKFVNLLAASADHKELLSGQDCQQQLQQLILTANFSSGFSYQGSTTFFSFLEAIINAYQVDHVAAFNDVLKIVLVRLDVKTGNAATALSLLNSLLVRMDYSAISDTVLLNLRFQLDMLLAILVASLTSRLEPDREAVATSLECFKLLQCLAAVPQYGQKVAEKADSRKLQLALRGSLSSVKDSTSKAKLTVEFLSLAIILGEASSNDMDTKWDQVFHQLCSEKEIVELVYEASVHEKNDAEALKKALIILNQADIKLLEESKVGGAEVEECDNTESTVIPRSGGEQEGMDSMLESVTEALVRMEVEPVITEAFQLASGRQSREREQVSCFF